MKRRRRRLYGMVESETPPEGGSYSRLGLVFDCVDADRFDESHDSGNDESALALVRVISTYSRLKAIFDLDHAPKEGDWLEIELDDQAGQPRAWILEARSDYSGPPSSTNVIGMRFITDEAGASRGRSVSRSPLISRKTVMQFCTVEQAPYDKESAEFKASIELAKLGKGPLHVRVIDVGQASCSALHQERDPRSPVLGYFDVGAPIFFHGSSFPSKFFETAPDESAVFLSHWDFDHYALALRRLPSLRELRWYAPAQQVGFNAAAFQRKLGSKLHFIGDAEVGLLGGPRLYKGTGSPDDRNGSGYVFCLENDDGCKLLTGDVGYEHIPEAARANLIALTVPHHGGSGGSTPPNGSGNAVASYGMPNRYRHPNENFLKTHSAAGWTVLRTAGHAGKSRGDRWL